MKVADMSNCTGCKRGDADKAFTDGFKLAIKAGYKKTWEIPNVGWFDFYFIGESDAVIKGLKKAFKSIGVSDEEEEEK